MKLGTSAILSLDVVGYTKRIAEDAEKTLTAMQRILRDVIRPSVKGSAGRIFKLMGDGALVEFESATDAINAASSILREKQKEEISLHAGIHVGDVMHNGTDVFGEAVNVASRLQANAQPDHCAA